MKAVQGKKKNKAANFVIQGSILAMAGILVRIIGMLYRMPLNDIIGKQGNGYYTSAYNVYNILLILSSYSMPVAISKMISARLAKGEYENCRRILKAGLLYATVTGGLAAIILWFGSDFFAGLFQLRLKNTGTYHLDHGVSGSFKRLFPGNRNHDPYCGFTDLRADR